jgi:hypothetical protein
MKKKAAAGASCYWATQGKPAGTHGPSKPVAGGGGPPLGPSQPALPRAYQLRRHPPLSVVANFAFEVEILPPQILF